MTTEEMMFAASRIRVLEHEVRGLKSELAILHQGIKERFDAVCMAIEKLQECCDAPSHRE